MLDACPGGLAGAESEPGLTPLEEALRSENTFYIVLRRGVVCILYAAPGPSVL
jgi:hypothetical protein